MLNILSIQYSLLQIRLLLEEIPDYHFWSDSEEKAKIDKYVESIFGSSQSSTDCLSPRIHVTKDVQTTDKVSPRLAVSPELVLPCLPRGSLKKSYPLVKFRPHRVKN